MDNSHQAVEVYNQISDAYANEFTEPSEFIDEFLELLPKSGNILDVGCGPGVDSAYATLKGFKVIGVDLSEKMLTIAKNKYPAIDFRLADIRQLQFKDQEFDGIIASCSLIHVPKADMSETLANFARMLNHNGIIYIGLQSGKSEELFINEPFKPDEKLFLNIMPFDEVIQLLNNFGFEILKKYERGADKKEELDFTKLFIIAKRKI